MRSPDILIVGLVLFALFTTVHSQVSESCRAEIDVKMNGKQQSTEHSVVVNVGDRLDIKCRGGSHVKTSVMFSCAGTTITDTSGKESMTVVVVKENNNTKCYCNAYQKDGECTADRSEFVLKVIGVHSDSPLNNGTRNNPDHHGKKHNNTIPDNPKDDDDSDSGIGTGGWVGVGVGLAATVLLLVIAGFVIARWKMQNRMFV